MPTDLTIDLSGLDKLFQPRKIAEAMVPFVEQAMQHARGRIVKRMPDGASGELRRAPVAMAVQTETGVEGLVTILETSPAYRYAQFVEVGRRPGKFPPWSEPKDPIYLYVKRKGLRSEDLERVNAKPKRKTKTNRTKADRLAMAFRSAAYRISRKIALFGTEGKHPFELGWAESEAKVQTIIEFGFQKAMTAHA